MPDSKADIVAAIDSMDAPVALFSLDGRVQYANEACWRRIFEIADDHERIPGLNYFALTLVGTKVEPVRRQLERIFSPDVASVQAEAAIGGMRWRICLCRFHTEKDAGVLAWHCRVE